jgi:hypothetical protein
VAHSPIVSRYSPVVYGSDRVDTPHYAIASTTVICYQVYHQLLWGYFLSQWGMGSMGLIPVEYIHLGLQKYGDIEHGGYMRNERH